MCEIQSWQGVLLALWAILEFWLGETDKVKAGSTLELIINGIKQLFGMFFPKKV